MTTQREELTAILAENTWVTRHFPVDENDCEVAGTSDPSFVRWEVSTAVNYGHLADALTPFIERVKAEALRDAAGKIQQLTAEVGDYRRTLNFGIECISCAKTLEKLYAAEAEVERLRDTADAVEALYVTERFRLTAEWNGIRADRESKRYLDGIEAAINTLTADGPMEVARLGLEAALPILRAQFAEEVATAIEVVFAKTEYGDGQVRIALNRLTERIRAAIMRNLGTK